MALWMIFSVYYFYPRSPRGERLLHRLKILVGRYFYPRSPRGERRSWYSVKDFDFEFLSTLSARRATAFCAPVTSRYSYFYPRSPRGERLGKMGFTRDDIYKISIHALREESDR